MANYGLCLLKVFVYRISTRNSLDYFDWGPHEINALLVIPVYVQFQKICIPPSMQGTFALESLPSLEFPVQGLLVIPPIPSGDSPSFLCIIGAVAPPPLG